MHESHTFICLALFTHKDPITTSSPPPVDQFRDCCQTCHHGATCHGLLFMCQTWTMWSMTWFLPAEAPWGIRLPFLLLAPGLGTSWVLPLACLMGNLHLLFPNLLLQHTFMLDTSPIPSCTIDLSPSILVEQLGVGHTPHLEPGNCFSSFTPA